MILSLSCVVFVLRFTESLSAIPVFEWKKIEFDVPGSEHGRERNLSCEYPLPTLNHLSSLNDWGNIQEHERERNFSCEYPLPPLNHPSSLNDWGNIQEHERERNLSCEYPLPPLNHLSSLNDWGSIPMGVTPIVNSLIIAVPRFSKSVLSTLNRIDPNTQDKSPKLIPYPDFETNDLTSSSPHLVSVYRTTLDDQNRLWFVDTGALEYPDNYTQLQRPALWAYDTVKVWSIVHFVIPESIVVNGRGLQSLAVDTGPGYLKTFVYVPDSFNNRLHVYDLENNKMWSFQHNYFHFDPIAGDFNIGGHTFRWHDGICSVTIGPGCYDDSRLVYFHALSSNNEFVVSSHILQNETNALRSYHGMDFRLHQEHTKNMQSTRHAYDPLSDSIFYTAIQQNSIYYFKEKNVARRLFFNKDMVYPSDLTIDDSGNLWVLSNSLPKWMYGTMNFEEINFRIYRLKVKRRN